MNLSPLSELERALDPEPDQPGEPLPWKWGIAMVGVVCAVAWLVVLVW